MAKFKKKDVALIEEDLRDQLERLSKFGKFYDDLVNDYLYLIELREKLKKDIKDKGVRYEFVNGNGKTQEKPNESVSNLIKVEQLLLKIINDLEINQARIPSSSPEEITKGDESENDLL